MRIALCNVNTANEEAYLPNMLANSELLAEAEIVSYQNVDTLIFEISDDPNSFDILVVFSGPYSQQGLAEAIRIRNLGCCSPIFTASLPKAGKPTITALVEHADLLPGPYEMTLCALLKQMAGVLSESDTYLYKKGRRVRRIPYDKIIYAESVNHTLLLHLDSEVLTLTKSLACFEEELSDCRFLRVHRSYLVNLDHVKRMERMLTLDNGEAVPVSRRESKSHRARVFAWLSSKRKPASTFAEQEVQQGD